MLFIKSKVQKKKKISNDLKVNDFLQVFIEFVWKS